MKTLVIHPRDKTTDYLKEIYSDKDWTVINHQPEFVELFYNIVTHDRIVMLGHGCGLGLFGCEMSRLVIDERCAPFLQHKECVSIWCYANRFFERHNLKGVYTGMIISEVQEAEFFLPEYNLQQIEASNTLFAEAFRAHITEQNVLDNVLAKYTGKENPVIRFNRHNIFVTKDSLFSSN